MEEGTHYDFFVGIDWATEKHDMTVLTPLGEKELEKVFENSAAGLSAMASALESFSKGSPEKVAIAIEVPHGPVVELLLDRGFHVYALNPKQLDRFRDRHTTIGAKDDRLDAFVLADSVRTDRKCFRRVKLPEAEMIQLRSLSRLHESLTVTIGRLSNQLREQVMRYAPHLLKLCPAAEKAWFWELLEMVANPADAATIKKYKIQKLLTRNRIRKVSCDDVLSVIRSPFLSVAPGVVEAALVHIQVTLRQLQLVNEQKKDIERQTKEMLETLLKPGKAGEHRDAKILLSVPGIGNVVAATMLSEASQALSDRDYETMRAQAGVAPVTKRSGKRLMVGMRYACSRRLRNAIYHWSMTSVQVEPRSRQKYAALRAKGHSHGRALRSVGDGLLRILFAMLRNQTLFDSSLLKEAA